VRQFVVQQFWLGVVGGPLRPAVEGSVPYCLIAAQDGGKGHLCDRRGRTQFVVLTHPPAKTLEKRMDTCACPV
jgi:hypothetical protein